MKNPKEYLEKWSAYKVFPSRELSHIIKQAQIDAYNEALEDAAHNVEGHIEWIKDGEKFDYTDVLSDEGVDYEIAISRQSILKLKK